MTTTSGDITSRSRKNRFPLTRKKWPKLIPIVKEAVIECLKTKKFKRKKR